MEISVSSRILKNVNVGIALTIFKNWEIMVILSPNKYIFWNLCHYYEGLSYLLPIQQYIRSRRWNKSDFNKKGKM